MNQKRKYAALVALLLAGGILFAQSSFDCGVVLPKEKVILHTDRDIYLMGEKIWFKAYDLVEGQLSDALSKVLLVELYDYQGRSLVQQKYVIEGGMASGAMDIPEEVATGQFFLRAYTQYLRNFPPVAYANKIITVINPLSDAAKIQAPEKSNKAESGSGQGLLMSTWKNIEVSVQKPQYSQREKVTLQLEGGPVVEGSLSISVRAIGTAGNKKSVPNYLKNNPWLAQSWLDQGPVAPEVVTQLQQVTGSVANPADINTLQYLPENRGISLSGVVRDKNTKTPVPGVICIASVVGARPQVHLNTSREDGSFIFAFDQLQGEQDLCVGMSNRDAGEVEILINNDFSTDFPSLQPVPLTFDSAQHRLFERMHLNEQLQKRFTWAKMVSSTSPTKDLVPSTNLGKPDEVVKVADFIDLPTLGDVIQEVIPFVKVKVKEGRRSLSIWDTQVELYNDNPVVLLDNVPIYDIDELLKLNPQNIKEIGIIYTNYILSDYLFGGMLSITTNTDNFAGYQWPGESVFLAYTTIASGQAFQYPDYLEPGARDSRKPDFRTTLYWNPSIDLADIDTSIDFYTSDFTGDYEVVVRGVTTDGQMLYGKTTFSVKR